MKSITINGSKRESVGKVATKALRNAGEVPCVLYGGEEPVHFAADERVFAKLVYTPNAHTVVIKGAAPGILNSGGVLSRNKRKLRVRALPANLPDVIEADISTLELGSKLYVTELADESFKFLHPDNTVVCQVRTSRTSLKVNKGEEGEETGAEGEEATEEAAE